MDADDLYFGTADFKAPENFQSSSYIPSPIDCMRCGLCIAGCPTYQLFKTEAETPRQRIRTIEKILNGCQSLSTEERMHLDNCLQCRACETVCPSKMVYGRLFDEAQSRLKRLDNFLAGLGFWLIQHKAWRKRLMPVVKSTFKTGIRSALLSTGLLKRLGLQEAFAAIPEPASDSLADYYPSRSGSVNGRVGLFTGCLGEHFDRATLDAAVLLLTTIGYDVHVPAEQQCCGAIHQHNGRSALPFVQRNTEIFNRLSLNAVIFTASGCGAMLCDYPSSVGPSVEDFKSRLYELNDFLLQHWPETVALNALDSKVAVHEPCSQRNVLINTETVYNLLKKIPGLTLNALPDNQLCCGAGGTYLVSHPENAAMLRNKKLESIRESAAEIVLSCNFGCALHLNQGGDKIIHPANLLARQLNKNYAD